MRKNMPNLYCIFYLEPFLGITQFFSLKFKAVTNLLMTRMWNLAELCFYVFLQTNLTYFWFCFVFFFPFPVFTRCWSLDIFCLNWKKILNLPTDWYGIQWDMGIASSGFWRVWRGRKSWELGLELVFGHSLLPFLWAEHLFSQACLLF